MSEKGEEKLPRYFNATPPQHALLLEVYKMDHLFRRSNLLMSRP